MANQPPPDEYEDDDYSEADDVTVMSLPMQSASARGQAGGGSRQRSTSLDQAPPSVPHPEGGGLRARPSRRGWVPGGGWGRGMGGGESSEEDDEEYGDEAGYGDEGAGPSERLFGKKRWTLNLTP